MARVGSVVAGLVVVLLVSVNAAQPPGGFQGPRPGGFGGQQQRQLVKQFDKNGDGWLNAEERQAARDFVKKERAAGRGGPGGPRPGGFGPPQPGQILPPPVQDDLALTPEQRKQLAELQKEVEAGLDKIFDAEQKKQWKDMRNGPPGGFGGPGGFGRTREPAKPGPRVSPAEVKNYPDKSLFEPTILRTIFLDFEAKDWEEELADFKGSDVEVPCTLTVDGKKYPNVGVHFRGMSSYMMVPAGYKRSLNLSLDLVDSKQRLYGNKTLNLLNGSSDQTMMSTVLFSHISRQYTKAPKANFVKVVVNGESWGVYASAQQFNKEFVAENFKSSKGARWKVRGSPGGGGGLDYLGDNIEEYKRRYQLKTKEDDKDWKALMELCRTLDKTPPDKLEAALKPMLDIEGALWFLALDLALQNEDGYWIRASDYSLYRDGKGKFHVIASDMNEAFQPAMQFGFGPGRPGGPGAGGGQPPPGGGNRGSGVEVDPLVGMQDARKPLRSKLLAVPALRERYLHHVRTIAEDWLDWKKLGPVVAQFRDLIDKEVQGDTRKLGSYEGFKAAVSDSGEGAGGRGISLRRFAEQRRKFLLEHAEVKKAAR